MRSALTLCVVVAVFGVAQAGETGWPDISTGRYPDADPPVEFSPTKNVVWAAPMPSWSNACLVVTEDRIFVCAEPDILLAVDKKTGKVLWQRANPVEDTSNAKEAEGQGKTKTHRENGYTSATPFCDGKHVYAVFGNGVVSAYDLDGRKLWSRFIEKPVHKWGHCASPILVGGKLIVQFEKLRALDPSDGSTAWTQDLEMWVNQRKKQWGTCAPARIGEDDVVVTITGKVIRISDGWELFSDLAVAKYATPLVHDGVVYFFDQTGARAIRLPGSTEEQPEVLWNAKTVKERYYGTPLLHDGVLYAITRRGHFSAFDAKDGKEIYQQKLLLAKTEKEPNGAYSSITLAGKLIYFMGMDGSIVVVKPGRTYEEVARNKVEHSLRTTPVFEGTRMYVRAPDHLYCFGR